MENLGEKMEKEEIECLINEIGRFSLNLVVVLVLSTVCLRHWRRRSDQLWGVLHDDVYQVTLSHSLVNVNEKIYIINVHRSIIRDELQNFFSVDNFDILYDVSLMKHLSASIRIDASFADFSLIKSTSTSLDLVGWEEKVAEDG